MARRFALALLCVILCVAPLAARGTRADEAPYRKTAAAARTEIWKAITGSGASSAMVAVMDDGAIVYSETFGMRDRAHSIPVDAHTQFNIGSVSKVFTAAAILLLTDEGKVALDEPVTAYLPEFTMADGRYADITVRTLLNHASGLPGSNVKEAFSAARDPNFIAETLEALAESELKHAPGELSVYCNDAFTLAEAVVERVSGMSFADFLDERIFQRASMADTSCYFKEGNPNIAVVYDARSGESQPTEYVNLMGSGGIASTAEDLCRFAGALFSDWLFSDAALEEFQKPQYGSDTVPGGVPAFQYGLGWDTVSLQQFEGQGVRVLSKNGGTSQFTSQLYVVPEERLSVALIVAGITDTGAIADRILQALLEEKGVLGVQASPAAPPPRPAPIPEELLDFEGHYGAAGRIIEVRFDRDRSALLYSLFDGKDFALAETCVYREDGFFHMGDGLRLSFVEYGGAKLIMSYRPTYEHGLIHAEALPELSPADGAVFQDKRWIPINHSAADLSSFMTASGPIPGMAGYVYYFLNGEFTPYALDGPLSARMCLRYARDQFPPRIDSEQGEPVLKMGRFLLMDAAGAAELTEGELVAILGNGRNECRRIGQDALFSSAIPEGGRVAVFTPQMQPLHDSLKHGRVELIVPAGSFVLFIGEAGDGFQTALSR